MDIRIQIAVLSAAAGMGLGYMLGKRVSSQEFDEAVAEACEENRQYFLRQAKKTEEHYEEKLQEFSLVAADATNALTRYRGEEELVEAATEVAQIQYSDYDETEDEGFAPNVASVPVPELDPIPVALPNDPENSPHPNPVHKPKHREPYVDKSKPYVIPVEEFVANENEWPQSTLTYYEGDDVLVDEEDQNILDDASRLLLVGTHLSDFGVQSNDPRAVYLRNEKMHLELEVLKDQSKYADKVAGLGE